MKGVSQHYKKSQSHQRRIIRKARKEEQEEAMATSSTSFITTLSVALLILFFNIPTSSSFDLYEIESEYSDSELLEFQLNLEFLQAEFFLSGSLGQGLDQVAPNLAAGGPAPLGAKKANLNALTADIMAQFGNQGVGHIRALKRYVEGFPRPLMDLSSSSFANMMNKAFGHSLEPPFNPYANSINFLLASYLLPYVALTGYEGLNAHLQSSVARRLCAGLLGVQSAQDAVIRALLYERASMKVEPYGVTVAEFTSKISELRNQLGGTGSKDEGLEPPSIAGIRGKHTGNLLAENSYSLCYQRAPKEILRIMYGKGTASAAGGFFPNGANGRIAQSLLSSGSI